MSVAGLGFLSQLAHSQSYVVRGESMTPGFRTGERLLVSGATYRRGQLERGDVVVVADPRDPEERYLKRVVGLPGEEVRIEDGTVLIDGEGLSEPYLGGLPAALGLGHGRWETRAGEYFVMGDNRAHSTDSRDFGPVRGDLIVGRAWLRYWPPKAWGLIGSRR